MALRLYIVVIVTLFYPVLINVQRRPDFDVINGTCPCSRIHIASVSSESLRIVRSFVFQNKTKAKKMEQCLVFSDSQVCTQLKNGQIGYWVIVQFV